MNNNDDDSGPPPPPPPAPDAPPPPMPAISATAVTAKKPAGSLKDQLKLKQAEVEPEKELTVEQLEMKESMLPKTECARCGKLILEGFMTEHQNSHSTEILPYLFLGGERNAHNKVELVKRTGITDILNVSTEVENIFDKCLIGCECQNGGIECSGVGKVATTQPTAPLFVYHTHRIKDQGDEPLEAIMSKALPIIEAVRERNGRILVHCVAGISRSASVVIAYLMQSQKISLKEAYNFVKERRTIVSPIAGFVRKLQDYERTLAESVELHGYNYGSKEPSLSIEDVYPPGIVTISSKKIPNP